VNKRSEWFEAPRDDLFQLAKLSLHLGLAADEKFERLEHPRHVLFQFGEMGFDLGLPAEKAVELQFDVPQPAEL
jgi:hypothetical protein